MSMMDLLEAFIFTILNRFLYLEENWIIEHAKLKARLDVIHKNQRNFMGEELDGLTMKELQHLEHQLDSALKQIRSRKTQKTKLLPIL